MADISTYYPGLLIAQYAGKPKAKATINAITTPVLMSGVALEVLNGFNFDGSAVGKQLDTIGKYIGVTRQGYNFTGPVTLSDADYYVLLKIKLIENYSTASLSDIQNLLYSYFPGAIKCYDYCDMTMEYVLNSSVISSNLAQMFVKGQLLPRPTGVRLRGTILTASPNPYFGFRTYELGPQNVSPFNTYDSYSQVTPWLTYASVVA